MSNQSFLTATLRLDVMGWAIDLGQLEIHLYFDFPLAISIGAVR